MVGAVSSFAADVRARRFPAEEHWYSMERGSS
jgi:ketopantoate hydroxymethyltransferase